MKLAAIDIGTNSIHMVIVAVKGKRAFEVIDREKEMVKLGVGVFATNRLSDRAFDTGLDIIERYIQLAEQSGVDDIIMVATSATREAQNGEEFLKEIVRRTKITPRIISGKEEARLIFLAVKNAIALKDERVMVLDIGGGSTEVVVGDRQEIFAGSSMKLGVLRLLDMVGDEGPLVDKKARDILEAHIQVMAAPTMAEAKQAHYTQVIGTSGTIRALGEAAYVARYESSLRSVNAEVVFLEDLSAVTDRLVALTPKKREKVEGVSEKRTDAIHLGGVLLVQLLKMAGVEKLTLCDASLREGMLLDYMDRHSQEIAMTAKIADLQSQNLRRRKAARLAYKYGSDWGCNRHIANLALQLFDQTQSLHELGQMEKEVLEYAALLHDIGQYLAFKKYHKSSRYILERADPRGFTDEEMLLIGHVIRYHRKASPSKKHKKFRRLSDSEQHCVRVLSGLLRIAIGLDRTKSQLAQTVTCQIEKDTLEIVVCGVGELTLELWAARGDRLLLEKALNRSISIHQAPIKDQ